MFYVLWDFIWLICLPFFLIAIIWVLYKVILSNTWICRQFIHKLLLMSYVTIQFSCLMWWQCIKDRNIMQCSTDWVCMKNLVHRNDPASLALCGGNPTVTGGRITWSSDVASCWTSNRVVDDLIQRDVHVIVIVMMTEIHVVKTSCYKGRFWNLTLPSTSVQRRYTSINIFR